MANRPDCAYFLLLGLCGAAFLLTIGGILTYIAFNPGAVDPHLHAAMSHIPHFHHHHPHQPSPNHQDHHPPPPINQVHHHPTTPNHAPNPTFPHPTNHSPNTSTNGITITNTTTVHPKTSKPHHSQYPYFHHILNVSATAAYDAKAKQSLILAIIGPLCLLVGIIVSIIVGGFALKYDCDHEPEPNISFLRLRSEMSLNYDGGGDNKGNNYELLRPSSSIEQAGGHFCINPTGIPEGT